MLLAGAGGHALEVLDILIADGMADDLHVFDRDESLVVFQGKYRVTHSEEVLKQLFHADPRFILGVGNPKVRQRLYEQLSRLGGTLFCLSGKGNVISGYADCGAGDVFNRCFIGPNTQIGKGCLINTGAQIHHEVQIGEFSEINPGAVLLGGVQIGMMSSIGANATILPRVKIGNHTVVGAGSVVTRDVPDGVTVVGVPGRVLRRTPPSIT